MSTKEWIALPRRGILSLSGEDAKGFLQGLITNDVDSLSPSQAIYAALLTPQGKFLHDFFMAECGDRLLLDSDGARLPDLAKRLAMYKLRAKVDIRDESKDWRVVALPGDAASEGAAEPWLEGIVFTDPRSPALGRRAILPADLPDRTLSSGECHDADFESYERLRISLGIPDGAVDLIAEKTLALEGRLDVHNGISFAKGCYVGQEVTVRMKQRNLVKRSLRPVTFEGPPPSPGSPVASGHLEAGEIRSGVSGQALAMLRSDLAEAGPLTSAGRTLHLARPPEAD